MASAFCVSGQRYQVTQIDLQLTIISPQQQHADDRSTMLHRLHLQLEVLVLLLLVEYSRSFSTAPSMPSFWTRTRQRPNSRNVEPRYSKLSSVPTTETTTTSSSSPSTTSFEIDEEEDTCEIGVNTVEECNTLQATESQVSVATNLAKCICGAGSFALPHVFLEEGVLGGTLAMTLCGGLAAYTMQSLAQSKQERSPSASYVQLTETVLGTKAAKLVFFLTLCASLGVCSTYLVFIGQTLESLSMDETSNYVQQFLPNVPKSTWEAGAALILFPLCLIRDYSIFAFTSALGVFAVVGGICVTLASGILVDPGLDVALDGMQHVKLWPDSLAVAFGGSFGTIAYLFCINFLTFPIMNSMKEPNKYGNAVNTAVAGVWLVNVVFAILCLAFYGNDTQDLVLANLDNGPYLSALKLLLCVDLLFTFPIVFSSGRQILENALLEEDNSAPSIQRAALVAGAVSSCFGLAQIGGFGAVANLVGGVAQGTLAFIMPPVIAVTISRQDKEETAATEVGQWMVGAFGVAVVSAVTYYTAAGMMQ